MQNLNVSLIQCEIVWENYLANLEVFEKKINAIESTDLILLPEMFTTGFSMKPEPVAQTMNGPSVAWMRKMSETKKADIAGSIIIKENGRFYNRLVWIRSNGEVHWYDKRHLFGLIGEDKAFSAGRQRSIIDIKGWKLAAFICYDLRFPVWSRNRDGYDVAIYIANWPQVRSNHWKLLLQARAIENQSYVVGLNRVGTDGNDIQYSGDSMVVDPLGEVLFLKTGEPIIHTHHLLKNRVLETRKNYPFLKDADAFRLLSKSE